MSTYEVISTIISSLALFVGMWNTFGIHSNKTDIKEVHKLTNSMSDKLQKQAGVIGEAKGRDDQRKEDAK